MSDEGREPPILESKLYPATGTRKPLPRPRLESLGDVLDGSYPVVLVVAPAGYGKSTLMAQWHANLVERGVPCAWLSLDEDDNDKVRFMRHLLAALQKADAHLGRALSRNLTADFPGDAKPLLQKLADDLASLRRRIVLFLDDLHFIREPEVLEIVDWLVNYAPRVVQQVIGSRKTGTCGSVDCVYGGSCSSWEARQLQFDLQKEAFARSSSRPPRTRTPAEELRRPV